MNFPKTQLTDYTYHLPEANIAYEPKEERSASKLLVYNKGIIHTDSFNNIIDCLPKGMFVYNNAKVIAARLLLKKDTGAAIEVFLLEPKDKDYSTLYKEGKVVWKCLVGNKKRWKDGELTWTNENLEVHLSWIDRESNYIEISWNTAMPFASVLAQMGNIPLPPYIKRENKEEDKTTYQTVYAKKEGAVAAPTAGLHFTDKVLEDIRNKGCAMQEVTLYVGAGTFKPVTEEEVDKHNMHTEKFAVSLSFLKALLANKEPLTCVGTTSLRVLESLYWMGIKAAIGENPLVLDKYAAYSLEPLEIEESLNALIAYLENNNLDELEAETGIFIVPGYTFRMVDALITNFHQPGSTLIMLVAAFIGEDWKKVYKYALDNDFRFLSYGDSSILLKKVQVLS